MTDRMARVNVDPDAKAGPMQQAGTLRNKDWLDLQRLRYHVEHTPLAVIEWGPGMRLTRWSTEAERIFGWKAEEVLGKGMEDFRWIYQEDKAQVAEVSSELQTGTNPRRYSANRNYRKDGSVIHCEWYNSSLVDESGRLHSVLSLVLDVTERKQAEEALHTHRELLETVINHLPVRMCLIRGSDLRLQMINPAYQNFAPGKDLVGKTVDEIWPEIGQNFTALCRRVLETGEPYHVEDERSTLRRQPDGPLEERYFSWSLYRVRLPGDEGWAILNPSWETTKRKQTEAELRKNQAKLEAAFASMMEAIFIADADGRLIDFNDEFICYHRFKDREEYSKTIAEYPAYLDAYFQHGMLAPLEMWPMPRALRGETGANVEYMLRRKDTGETWWGSYNFGPIKDENGRITGAVVAARDITERKKVEQDLQQLNANLERIVEERTAEATALAIQLRELASELTLTEQRERQSIAKVLHDHIQQMLVAAKLQTAGLINRQQTHELKTSAKLVSDLIDQTISASRNLTAELSPPVLYDAGFGSVLQWLARNFLEKHGLQVEVTFDPSGEPRVEDLRIFLFDAAREILFNVVKHSGAKKAHVECFRGKDNRVHVVVRDEGKGFDPGRLRTGERSEGFGLFSIQQRLKHLGGSVEIYSSHGNGTRVAIIGPPPPDDQPPPHSVSQQEQFRRPADKESHTGKIRVVLADDHHIMRQGLAGLLRSESDIEIVGEASNGAQAINLARSLQPDIVVMDVSMPVLNGVEATAEIRRDMPDIKVIGLSMHEEGELSSAMRQAGAVAYVTKGGSPEALVTAIRKAAGKAQ